MEAPLPENEADRLTALYRLRLLDQGPAPHLDRITRIAQNIFDVPIALVALVDANRQWFASRQGLDVNETPRCDAFCAHTILKPETMVIPDAQDDPRFVDNPLVTGPPHIRFYAGAPVGLGSGERVGTLCIIDRRPRQLEPMQLEILGELAGAVEREFQVTGLLLADPLTGLANRLAVEDAGHRLLELARRRLDPMSLLHVGLDNFKMVNKTRGHASGDAHLLRVAEVLRITLRRSDVIGRLCGDQFVAVLPDTGAEGAAVAADNIEYAFAQATAEHPGLPPLEATVSVTTLQADENFREFLERSELDAVAAKAKKQPADTELTDV